MNIYSLQGKDSPSAWHLRSPLSLASAVHPPTHMPGIQTAQPVNPSHFNPSTSCPLSLSPLPLVPACLPNCLPYPTHPARPPGLTYLLSPALATYSFPCRDTATRAVHPPTWPAASSSRPITSSWGKPRPLEGLFPIPTLKFIPHQQPWQSQSSF